MGWSGRQLLWAPPKASDWIPGNDLSHDLQEPEDLWNSFSEKTCLANTPPQLPLAS